MGARRKTRARLAWTAGAAALLAAILSLLVSRAARDRPAADDSERVRDARSRGAAAEPPAPARFHVDLGVPSPSAGWEEEAWIVASDLRRLLEGRPRTGAYEEARAEAARGDLALYPPERSRLRRLLLGSERERLLALAALSARPELDDDLLMIVLRSQRPGDDDLVRLLGAEIASALPAELLGRHEEDLLRAFEHEENPLVLAVAIPALERMEEARLRALLRAQLARASPESLPVLLALARSRLGSAALAELVAVTAPPAGRRE